MLMGLAAKTPFSSWNLPRIEADAGVNVFKAALHAAQLRFRPILMTSLAFILGIFPLGDSQRSWCGQSPVDRHGVFFGMIAAVTVGHPAYTVFLRDDIQCAKQIAKEESKMNLPNYDHMKSSLWIGAACVLLLGSCQLGKHYTRPELDMPHTLALDGMAMILPPLPIIPGRRFIPIPCSKD